MGYLKLNNLASIGRRDRTDARSRAFPPQTNSRPSTLDSRLSRRGFTLIEMLIVITIMLMLIAAGATMMRPDVEGRRLREAAREVNVYLNSARNRALETGMPCGVTFRNFGAPGFALTADQCEVPPCYSGDTEQSMAQVTYVNGNIVNVTFVDGTTPVTLPNGLIRPGDAIQFNYQGPLYAIAPTNTNPQTNPVDGNGYLAGVGSPALPLVATFDATQIQYVPWATTKTVPYRIYRSPIKGAAQALQMPAGTVVDLTASGNTAAPGGNDFTILFSPNGGVACVYVAAAQILVTDPIFLLVGKRGRMLNASQQPPTTDNKDQWANWQDGGNIWVVVNPQTGVVTSEVVTPTSTTPSDPAYVDPSLAAGAYQASGLAVSRQMARQAQGMGGK